MSDDKNLEIQGIWEGLNLDNRLREIREGSERKLEEVAAKAGISPSYLSRLERGGRNLSLKTIVKLARALGVPENQIVGKNLLRMSDAFARTMTISVTYGGIVEAGAFRPVDMLVQEPHRMVEVAPDPAYPRCRQYAFEVHGDSMNDARIEDGMWVLTIDYIDFVKFHGEARDGRFVVVERTRYQDSEREFTVKELRLFRDRMELIPRSKSSAYEPLIVPFNKDPSDDVSVRIFGVVTKAFWDLDRR